MEPVSYTHLDVYKRQQKKMPEATQQEGARGGMDLQQLWELIKEDSRKNMEELDKKFESINVNFKKQGEKLDRINENFRKLSETMDRGFTQLNETLNSTFGGNKEKTEIQEDPSTLLHQNKGNKKESKHKGTNRRGMKNQIIKKTKKMPLKKLINTREELEMMKNGPVSYTHLDVYKRQQI